MSGTAQAQGDEEGFSFSGAMRLRYETISGQPRVGFNRNDDLVNLRTNLLAHYRKADVELGLEVYDSRVWAERDGTPVCSATNWIRIARQSG